MSRGPRYGSCRSLAKRRKVVNDDEVSTILADFGFETVFAENLSFAEQADNIVRTAVQWDESHPQGYATTASGAR